MESDSSSSSHHHDSDYVDSETEARLYETLYYDGQATENGHDVQPASSMVNDKKVDTVVQPPPRNEEKSSRNLKEIITIDSDSEDEPSKIDFILRRCKKLPRKTCTISSDSESSDGDVKIISFVDQKLQVSNLHGHNEGLSKISLSKEMKETLGDAGDESDKTTTIQKNALTSFLEKCRPNYAPCSTDHRPPRKRKFTELDETVNDTPCTPRKMTLELLNSLPGDTNRFKKVKLDVGEDPDLWKVDVQDLQFVPKRKSRYYTPGTFKCDHCKEFTDHPTRECNFPRPTNVCYLCGSNDHQGFKCRKVICGKCRKAGHVTRLCKLQIGGLECVNCGLYGHLKHHCPNQWRQFFMSTKASPSLKSTIRKNPNAWCPNCCGKGHFGFECQQRQSSGLLPVSQFLIPTKKMTNRVKPKQNGPSVQSLPSIDPQNSTTTKKTAKKKKAKAVSVTPSTRKTSPRKTPIASLASSSGSSVNKNEKKKMRRKKVFRKKIE